MKIVGLILAVVLAFSHSAEAKSPDSLISDATMVLREIAAQPDNAPLKYLLNNAYGVAIFPDVIRVGLGLGEGTEKGCSCGGIGHKPVVRPVLP